MGESEYIIKLRGLPYSTTVDDIVNFLSGVNIFNGKEGVHLTEIKPGRPSGQCYVEVASPEDIELACEKDRQNLGKRYIEVFKSDRQEMQWATKPVMNDNKDIHIRPGSGVVRLRGLPFGCSHEQIAEFFDGLELIPDGINILSDKTGRSSGEAFVQFVDQENAERALEKDSEKIGHRYIEVFLSSADEAYSYASSDGPSRGGRGYGRPTPYDRPGGDRFGGPHGFGAPRGFGSSRGSGGRGFSRGGGGPSMWNHGGGGGLGGGGGGGGFWRGGEDCGGGGGNHSIHMRGLPFKATPSDIAFFFKPVRPLNVTILYDNDQRPSGEADVTFECHDDALRAMRRDKCNLENRYIELFLNSSGGGGGLGGGYGRSGVGQGYGRGGAGYGRGGAGYGGGGWN